MSDRYDDAATIENQNATISRLGGLIRAQVDAIDDLNAQVDRFEAAFKAARAREILLDATIERVKALIDPAAGMAQPLYDGRYFCEADIRKALGQS